MENIKTVGQVLIVIGLIILVVALLADPIGLGGDNSSIGPYQIAGIIVGAIVAVAGVVLVRRN
jgi:hypothetical protein